MTNARGSALYFTGSGSRDTSAETLNKLSLVAARLNALGYVLRVGCSTVVCKALSRDVPPDFFAITRPTTEAMHLARLHHPGWKDLSKSARVEQGLVVHRVLGPTLGEWISLALCHTVSGVDSNLTIRLANAFRVPVFNLGVPGDLARLRAMVIGVKQESNDGEYS